MKTKVKVSKKFYYIYKTTNTINNRFYIGMHSANSIDNNYLGSGSVIKSAIQKYGKENFTKEILFFVKSKEELIQKEQEIVTLELIENPMCMNLKPGGGCEYVVTVPWTEKRREQQSNRVKGENNPIYGRLRTKAERKKISKNHADVSGTNNPMFGGHEESTKIKISITRREKFLKGELNYSTTQITESIHKCPYCNIITNKGNLNRWHLKKCKNYKED